MSPGELAVTATGMVKAVDFKIQTGVMTGSGTVGTKGGSCRVRRRIVLLNIEPLICPDGWGLS
jgi:hypothetical protein